MADEVSLRDDNNTPNLIGLTTAGEVRNVRTNDAGAIYIAGSTGTASSIGAVTIQPSTAATLSSVAASTTVAVLLAASTARKMVTVASESTSSGTALMSYSTAATLAAWSVPIAPGGYWEMPLPQYTGALSVITRSGAATLLVTETV